MRPLISLLFAIAMTLAAVAQQTGAEWRTVSAGVEHAHIARTAATAGAPVSEWNINALRISPIEARVDVVHAMDQAVGLETVSAMAQRHGAIAAVNGGYFRTTGTYRGDSIGTLRVDGTLWSEPDRARSSVGFVRAGATTRLLIGNVTWQASLVGGGATHRIDGINRPRAADELIVFTPSFHRTTLTDQSGVEVIVRAGRVAEIREDAGSSVIPADGFVVSASGTARRWVARRLRKGGSVTVRQRLVRAEPSPNHAWDSAEDILGGGPTIVTAGRVDITDKRESMIPTFASALHPRTAIGSTSDGRILLVVVDGRQPGLSVGMSLPEVARLMIDLGATEAMNLDGGGSSTMVVQGKVVNHPSDPTGERPVSDAIIVRRGQAP
jgi:exopolysaccharide biosynthesis protein